MSHTVGNPRRDLLCVRKSRISTASVERFAKSVDLSEVWRPRLAPGTRLRFDQITKGEMLLFPEAALALNGTGAAIVRLCDGQRSTGQIIDELEKNYLMVSRDAIAAEVTEFLDRLRVRGLLR